MSKIKFIDLFCGIGSFHHAFRSVGGFECVFACDIDKYAKESYRLNYGMEPAGDIHDVATEDVPNHDILCAGFPCTSFSTIGNRAGFNCEPGMLFFEILRIIDGKNPKVVVLENVFGLLSHAGGETFEKIIFELKKRDYDVKWELLKCSDYGIPQMRRRLFIIASKKDAMVDVDKLFELDEYKKDTTLTEFYKGKNLSKNMRIPFVLGHTTPK
jgi:DNA (cytosine-5)-methyltransferase 1